MGKMKKYVSLSVITVTFNCEKTIESTISSVLEQEFYDLEYIFIDGKSNDKTVDIIKKIMDKASVQWSLISEKDNGIYDAMNKGICLSKGQYVLFLNAGDILKSGVLKKALCNIEDNNETNSILYGDSTNVYFNTKGEELFLEQRAPYGVAEFKKIKVGMCGLRHQAMLFPRSVFEKVGLYDLNFPISSDWDHMITCMENGIEFSHIDVNFCNYRMDGISTKPNLYERHAIRKKHKMYKIIDFQYLKEIFSVQNVLKVFFGQKFYNDILFTYHYKNCKGRS